MSNTCGKAIKRMLIIAGCVAGAVHAQAPGRLVESYPSKPVRILVGNAPGGGTDAVARFVGQKLGDRWSRPVIVDNRAGGTGVISMEITAQAAPDGHTLLLGSSTLAINMLLKKVTFDIRKAYAPVVGLTSQPYVVAVNPSLPVNSIKELILYAKSKPGTISFGSPGNGSPAHLGIELLKSMVGIDMLHVPYKGNGPAMIDLISGQIQLLFGTVVSVAPHVRSGRLKALAVTSLHRTQALPELPTVSEAGVPNYDLNNAYGFYAPAGTPAAIVAAINRESNLIISTQEFKARLAADGVEAALPNTPAEFKSAIDRDVARLEKLFSTPGMSTENFR